MNNIWGIDLGGTKIEGVILESKDNPRVLARLRVPTEANKGYSHVLSQVSVLVSQLASEVGYRASSLGMCTPGNVMPSTGFIKNSNAICLNGEPMKADLQNLLGINVEMANDANCFALAETRLGIVRRDYPNAKVVFGIILGTGVGGGLIIDGQIINGHHGITGEWGHIDLPTFHGRMCMCGSRTHLESVICGPSLEWFYEQKTGTKKSLKQIVDLARQGTDRDAKETLKWLTDGFAKAVSILVNLIDPDVIVIGGGVSNIDELYTDGVNGIAEHVFNREFNTPIVRPLLGDSAGVFGAAFLTEQ